MTQRVYDLEVLDALVKLSRMFAIAAQQDKAAAHGLAVATNLVKLWSMNYAPSHPSHPFPGFSMKDLANPEVVHVPPPPEYTPERNDARRAKNGDDRPRFEKIKLEDLAVRL